METTNLQKTIGQIFDGGSKYVIPLYQRNFAWRQEQIEQLLQDIYEAFNENKDGHYFIGSLVVLKRNNGDFEVIDGQQRLTTLSLITKILDINKEPRLFYDSRPEAEKFFDAFYKATDHKVKLNYPSITHLKNAIEFIQNAELNPNKLGTKLGASDFPLNDFKNYFSNNVFLVRVEIPADTDVASYFEIMNNRGEQLQKHEILKSLMISKIKDEAFRKEFALIWDACSQMDTHIQKLFSVEKRRYYFGDNYDTFIADNIFQNDNQNGKQSNNEETIDAILNKTGNFNNEDNNNSEDTQDFEETESKYKSIIDFPNFLMHILKLYLKYHKSDDISNTIPLNEKYLLEMYKNNEEQIDSEEFVKLLFYCRVVFDRYVVKTIINNKDNEDGETWTLRKPSKSDKSWQYVNTFGKEQDGENQDNNRIIKALSMLQVSFRNRIYKKWLYEILNWMAENKFPTFPIDVKVEDYVTFLHSMIYRYYAKNVNFNKGIINGFDEDNYKNGTDTPHFLFNFIDYLYWVDSKSTDHKSSNSEFVKDFDFKYWNSVEHHMAREWAEKNGVQNKEKFIDNLGNLCLISKSSNSRLSDRDVKEKVMTFGKGNLGPNRQVMYKLTENNNYNWGEEQILLHYNELVKLLNNSGEILGIKIEEKK